MEEQEDACAGIEPAELQDIKAMFTNADVSGDGKMQKEELARILKNIAMTDEHIDEIFEASDTNKDGVVDFGEFLDWVFMVEEDPTDLEEQTLEALEVWRRRKPVGVPAGVPPKGKRKGLDTLQGCFCAGGDVQEGWHTLEEAKEICLKNPDIGGFTWQGSMDATDEVYIFFKEAGFDDVSDDCEWCRMVKRGGGAGIEPPPAALCSETVALGEYKQLGMCDVDGFEFPICGFCEAIPSHAVEQASTIMDLMLRNANRDVLGRMKKCKCELGIIGRNQVTTDMPPHAHFKGTPMDADRDWDTGTRGLGGTIDAPTSTVGEENVTMENDEFYRTESILVHEFGHAVMSLGFNDKQMLTIGTLYEKYIAAGYDPDVYMFSDPDELWAEATQAWFKATLRVDVNCGIQTPEDLSEKLPELAALCEEVYGPAGRYYRDICAKPDLFSTDVEWL